MRSPDINAMYIKGLSDVRNEIDAPKGLKICRNVLFKNKKIIKYEHKRLSTKRQLPTMV